MSDTIKPKSETKIMCLEHDIAELRRRNVDLRDELNAANKVIDELEEKYNKIRDAINSAVNNKEWRMDSEIRKLSMYNPTVKNFLDLHRRDKKVTYEEALEGMVVALAYESKRYFDRLLYLERTR